MEDNKILDAEEEMAARLTDPEILGGNGNMRFVDCFFCKYSDAKVCKFFNVDKLDAPVDLFACPYQEKSEQGQKSIDKMFGMNK